MIGFITGDNEFGLTPTKDTEIRSEINKAKEMWNPFYAKMKVMYSEAPAAEKMQAFAYINQENIFLLQEMNQLTALYQAASNDLTLKLFCILSVLVFFTSILVVGAWCFLEKKIVKPIRGLSERTKQLAKGNLTFVKKLAADVSNTSINNELSSKDEIDELSNNFTVMAENFKVLIVKIQDYAGQVASSSKGSTEILEQHAMASNQMAGCVSNVALSTEKQAHA